MATSEQETLLRKITAWQSNGHVHPLTCGKDSNHPHLVGRVEGDTVILACPQEGCGYTQTFIPAMIHRFPA